MRTIVTPADLPEEFASWRRTTNIAPGLLFPSSGPAGGRTVQYRPDKAVELEGEDRARKYLFPTGATPVVAVHPDMVDRIAEGGTMLIVEGTKQALAAVSAAPAGVLVAGIAGCQGWRSDGVPLADWNHLNVDGRHVVIAFDADLATNRAVHDAGRLLGEHLTLLGVETVRYLKPPTGAKAGLDDYLATIAPERRQSVLARLIEAAGPLPKAPAKQRQTKPASDDPAAQFFGNGGLQAATLLAAVREGRHHALGPDRAVWTYNPETGLYVDDKTAVVKAVRDLLGERYRPESARTVAEMLTADLAAEGHQLPEHPIGQLVAVRNGMLDVWTGTLHPHGPEHLAYAGLAVDWRPEATCPTFNAWIAERCGNQVDDLLETFGLVLTPHVGQRRTPFLIGPTRSGKGTLLRLVEALIPAQYRAAETLHTLTANQFARAQLYGRILNSAGDLSDRHVDDLAVFKMLSGADSVTAERKFRDSFVFRNHALFAFSANLPPTVSEGSRAYLARIRPFMFPASFEDREDASIETRMLDELDGIFVRLVEGAQRWLARGGYGPVNPIVADTFARMSDPVAMFVASVLEPHTGGFVSTSAVYGAYTTWAITAGRSTLGRGKFLDRADNTLGPRCREHANGTGSRGWRGWRLLPEFEWVDGDVGFDLESIGQTSASYASDSQTDSDSGRSGADVCQVSATSASFIPIYPRFETLKEGEDEEREKTYLGIDRGLLAELAEPETGVECDPDPIVVVEF